MNEETETPLAEAQRLTDEASACWNAGDYPAVEALCRRALDLTRAAVAPEDPRVAERLYNLGSLLHFQHRFAEAEPILEEAIRIHELQPSADLPALAFCCAWLARTRFDAWRDGPTADNGLNEAEAGYLRALDLLNQAAADRTPEYAGCLVHLATLYQFRERFGKAIPLLQQALKLREEIFGRDHLETADVLGKLALAVMQDAKSNIDPEPFLRRACATRRAQLDASDPARWEWTFRMAEFCAATNRDVEARKLFTELESAIRNASPAQPDDVDWIVTGVIDHLSGAGQTAAAAAIDERWFSDPPGIRAMTRELAQREEMLGPDHPLVADSLFRLAEELRLDNRIEEAIEYYERALVIHEGAADKLDGSTQPSRGELPILNGLAMALRAQSNWDLADDLLERACAIPLDGTEETLIQHARATEQLAWVRYATEGAAEAESRFLSALKLVESQAAPRLHEIAELRYRFSIFLSQEARFTEAEQSVVAAIDAAARSGDVDPLEVADYREQYAAILHGLGLPLQADVQLAEVKRAWRESGAPREDL